jgi:hypothetical protein
MRAKEFIEVKVLGENNKASTVCINASTIVKITPDEESGKCRISFLDGNFLIVEDNYKDLSTRIGIVSRLKTSTRHGAIDPKVTEIPRYR